MRRRTCTAIAAAALAGAAVLALAGCDAQPFPAPTVTATVTSTATTTVTPSPAPSPSETPALVVPDRTAAEVTRATVEGDETTQTAAPFPAGRRFTLRAACTGSAGSTITYAMLDQDDLPFGLTGTVRCTGAESVQGLDLPATEPTPSPSPSASPSVDRPQRVQLRITTEGTVELAYAVLTRR